jgi:hypothetical protein
VTKDGGKKNPLIQNVVGGPLVNLQESGRHVCSKTLVQLLCAGQRVSAANSATVSEGWSQASASDTHTLPWQCWIHSCNVRFTQYDSALHRIELSDHWRFVSCNG